MLGGGGADGGNFLFFCFFFPHYLNLLLNCCCIGIINNLYLIVFTPAIHRAAGPELLEACFKVPQVRRGIRCPTGEARITLSVSGFFLIII